MISISTIKNKISSEVILLLVIILLGFILRFYKINENLVFHGELGDNYLNIKNFVINKELPLLGPPTSHPWLNFGPLYYWFFGPLLAIGGYQPLVLSLTMALISTMLIPVNYWILKKNYNHQVAILSSFFISISPSLLNFTRESRFFSVNIILIYPLIYFILKSLTRKQNIFWVGILIGIMLNFHLSALVLIPATILFYVLSKAKFSKNQVWLFLIGLLVPNLPFIIYNLLHGMVMLFKFSIWLPFRVAGFIGIYPKNNLDLKNIYSTLNTLYQLGATGILVKNKIISWLIIVPTLIVFYNIITRTFSGLRIKKIELLLGLFLFFNIAAGVIHGSPPLHYFVNVITLPIILFSIKLVEMFNNNRTRFFPIILVISIIWINFNLFFSENWFYLPQDKYYDHRTVPFALQEEIAQTIYLDSRNQPYYLERVGESDKFEQSYSQNYKFLLWKLGNEPKKEDNYSLKYTIFEKSERLPRNLMQNQQLFEIANIAIVKEMK